MQHLQCQARGLGLPLRLCVWKMHGHVIWFYERLGFVAINDLGVYLEMEWPGKGRRGRNAMVPTAAGTERSIAQMLCYLLGTQATRWGWMLTTTVR